MVCIVLDSLPYSLMLPVLYVTKLNVGAVSISAPSCKMLEIPPSYCPTVIFMGRVNVAPGTSMTR